MRSWLALTLTLVSAPALAGGQADTGTISGRISDQTGEALLDADVRVSNPSTSTEVSTRSNDAGIYVVRSLRPGLYRLTIEKAGFRTIVLDGLTLAAQDALGRNFTMELTPASVTVTVAASGEVRNLSSAVGTTVDRQFVDEIPLNGRSFQSLIQLAPGVLVTAAGQGMEGQFSVNGQRSNANYFTVDGVSANFASTFSVTLGQSLGGSLPALTSAGGTNSLASVDAMEEFHTHTSGYAAEFGRSPGAQIAIVTRSGTNAFHGTAYEYFRSDALDARNWFNPPPEPEPPLRQHDFGGTLGGPLRKNHSFFFFSYEGLRLDQPRTGTGTFYTPETRAAVAPVYQPLVNALPLPTGPVQNPSCDNRSTPCLAGWTAAYSNPTNFDGYSLRIDQALWRQWTMFGRVSHSPSAGHPRAFSNIEHARLNNDLAVVGLTAILSPRLVSDLRVGWGHAAGTADIAIDDAFGSIVPSPSFFFPPGTTARQAGFTLAGGGSVSVGTRAANFADQWNLVETLALARGRHDLKFGVDYRRFQSGTEGRSLYIVLLNQFSQLVNGTMGSVGVSVADPITMRHHNWSVFAQDMWRPTERLTLTAGVRWEVNTAPVSITEGRPLYAIEGIFDAGPVQLAPAGTPLWRMRYNNFGPRFGASYAAGRSTVVRGSVGLFNDLGYGRLVGSLVDAFPYRRDRTAAAVGTPFDLSDPAFTPEPFSTSLTAAQGNVVAFDPELQLPQTWQWNVALEQQLGAHQSLTATYVGAEGRRLLRPDFVVPQNVRATVGPAILSTRNAGVSRYAAFQLQLKRRLSRGLQALGSYTLAEARDTESDDSGGNFTGAPLNANSGISIDSVYVPPLAPADFDIRHSFSAAFSFAVPAPSGGSFAQAFLRDWAIDGIVRASSAPPVNVRIRGVSAQLGTYNTQPDLVPGQPMWLPAPDQPGAVVLNPGAFTLPPAGQPGNLARNSIRGVFGVNQTDLAIRRRFPIRGRRSLEFRAEAFNVFNHPMFGEQGEVWGTCGRTPCTGQQTPSFGTTTNTLNEALGGGGLNGGQSVVYAVGGPRSIQLSLKLRY